MSLHGGHGRLEEGLGVGTDAGALLQGNLGASSLACLGLLGGDQLATTDSLGVGVELEHDASVAQGVLLAGSLGRLGGVGGTNNGLNFVTVDETVQVGVGHHGSRKLVASLGLGFLAGSAEDLVQALEGTLSPDG